MDLLKGFEDGINSEEHPQPPPDPGDFKMPSLEEMMKIINEMDMPEEEKLKLVESLSANNPSENSGSMFQNNMERLGPHYAIVMLAISIVLFIFAFIVYKIFKFYSEKERKKDAKRKQKLMKKKK